MTCGCDMMIAAAGRFTFMRNYYYEEEQYRNERFDPFIALKGSRSADLISFLVERIEAIETRSRKRKARDKENLRLTADAIVANAMRVAGKLTSNAVHYSRKSGSYTLKNYFPDWLGCETLTHVIDIFEADGFLATTLGDNSDQITLVFRKRPQSTFRATAKLVQICREFGVTSHSIKMSDDAPVLFIKDRGKQLIRFDRSEKFLSELGADVRTYNAYVAQHSFSLKNSWVEVTKSKETLDRVDDLDFDRTFLFRSFNHSSWEEGGRWFGGWWQQCPSIVRPYILINGEPTVELDYSGFLTRALYHHEGINYQEADPYNLPEVMETSRTQGLDVKEVRRSVKKLMNVLINAREHQYIRWIGDISLPKAYPEPEVIYSLLKGKHKAIAHHFRTGIGLKMMFKESEVCRRILLEGVDKEIVVLPIHDSYIVQEQHEEWLRSAMASHYRAIFRFAPVIKGGQRAGELTPVPGDSVISGDLAYQGDNYLLGGPPRKVPKKIS